MSAGRACHYCGAPDPESLDHVIPKALGGPNHRWNLVPACKPCNGRKADQHYEAFTGRRTLPRSCIDMGFMTTDQFTTFRRQLTLWEEFEEGASARAITRAKRLAQERIKPAWTPPGTQPHPAWVGKSTDGPVLGT